MYEVPDEPGDIGSAGDVGPEGLTFIPFFLSPDGRALVVAANEVSGTTTIYQLSGFPFWRPCSTLSRPESTLGRVGKGRRE